MNSATQHQDGINEACAFLQSFVNGRKGYTPDDVRGGIIRLKAQCLAMQNTYGASQKLMMDLCQDTAEKVIEEAEKLLALRR